MRDFLIKINSWFRLLAKTCASCVKILLFSKSTKQYKNLAKSEKDILILGNGPSLNSFIENHKEKIKNYNLIAVNHFAISEFYTELKPKYYIAIAHDLYLDDVMPHFLEASNKLFNTLVEKTDWNLKFFITTEARKHQRWQEILKKNSNVEIIYINLTPIDGFKNFKFRNFDKLRGMPRPHNIMVPAIFTALNLQAKNILLAGVDHSWLKELQVDNDNKVLLFNQHFYDNEIKAKQFDYMGQRYVKLHEILYTLGEAFKSYHILKEYADYKQAKIFNLTENSFIDAFERVNFEELNFKNK